MTDDTAEIRRSLQAQINERKASREALEAEFGQVWTTEELAADFEVIGFAAPLVVARRKIDGRKGSLYFQHAPRFYYGWQEDH